MTEACVMFGRSFRADQRDTADPVDAVAGRPAAQVTVCPAGYRLDQSGGHTDEDVIAEEISAAEQCSS